MSKPSGILDMDPEQYREIDGVVLTWTALRGIASRPNRSRRRSRLPRKPPSLPRRASLP